MPPTSQQVIWDSSRVSSPHTQPDKAQRVRAMFDAIAPTYELVNRVLSAGRDAHWRRHAVKMADVRSTDRVLDLACGTGDFARAFAAAVPARVVGSDFSARMLEQAATRAGRSINWCRGDAHHLPFLDESFSIVSCAFGVRNFQSLDRGLAEMFRVLAPGGRAIILEFSMPRSKLLGGMYRFYFRNILPMLARLISRDRSGAYEYLPKSVESFIDDAGMTRVLHQVGFESVTRKPMTIGIVTIYLARKSQGSGGGA